jgi:hypothetical protein
MRTPPPPEPEMELTFETVGILILLFVVLSEANFKWSKTKLTQKNFPPKKEFVFGNNNHHNKSNKAAAAIATVFRDLKHSQSRLSYFNHLGFDTLFGGRGQGGKYPPLQMQQHVIT